MNQSNPIRYFRTSSLLTYAPEKNVPVYRYWSSSPSGLTSAAHPFTGLLSVSGLLGRDIICWELRGMYWEHTTRKVMADALGLLCVDYEDPAVDVVRHDKFPPEEYSSTQKVNIVDAMLHGANPVIDVTPPDYVVIADNDWTRDTVLGVLDHLLTVNPNRGLLWEFVEGVHRPTYRVAVYRGGLLTGVVFMNIENPIDDWLIGRISYMWSKDTRSLWLLLKACRRKLTESKVSVRRKSSDEKGVKLVFELSARAYFEGLPKIQNPRNASPGFTRYDSRAYASLVERLAYQARQEETSSK